MKRQDKHEGSNAAAQRSAKAVKKSVPLEPPRSTVTAARIPGIQDTVVIDVQTLRGGITCVAVGKPMECADGTSTLWTVGLAFRSPRELPTVRGLILALKRVAETRSAIHPIDEVDLGWVHQRDFVGPEFGPIQLGDLLVQMTKGRSFHRYVQWWDGKARGAILPLLFAERRAAAKAARLTAGRPF